MCRFLIKVRWYNGCDNKEENNVYVTIAQNLVEAANIVENCFESDLLEATFEIIGDGCVSLIEVPGYAIEEICQLNDYC